MHAYTGHLLTIYGVQRHHAGSDGARKRAAGVQRVPKTWANSRRDMCRKDMKVVLASVRAT